MAGCCAPTGPERKDAEQQGAERQVAAPPTPQRGASVASGARPDRPELGLVALPGGVFRMGGEDWDANRGDGEGPIREVEVSPFSIGSGQVTNARFRAFVDDTGHLTGAERFGWSFVFAGFLPSALRRGAQRPESAPWWCRVDGAAWQSPEGPGSDLEDRDQHPVVHVDHGDALAFCEWARVRLPTEAEWEYAARGGLDQARYPWGDVLVPGGAYRCNIWQGQFPVRNSAEDGHLATCAVDTFAPNGFGLHGVAGNVWEWCADWWSVTHHAEGAPGVVAVDPQGPAQGTSRVMRGGSYLCHDSYCNRYRVAARTSNDPDSSSGNVGFRVALSG